MSDATVEGLQCHPEGHVAGRKGQVRKDPPKRQLAGSRSGRRKGMGQREDCAERGCLQTIQSITGSFASHEGGW